MQKRLTFFSSCVWEIRPFVFVSGFKLLQKFHRDSISNNFLIKNPIQKHSHRSEKMQSHRKEQNSTKLKTKCQIRIVVNDIYFRQTEISPTSNISVESPMESFLSVSPKDEITIVLLFPTPWLANCFTQTCYKSRGKMLKNVDFQELSVKTTNRETL